MMRKISVIILDFGLRILDWNSPGGIDPKSAIQNPKSSAVLQNDPLQRVPDVLAAVQRLLDVVVQFLPLDDLQRLSAAVEQAAHRGVVVVVADAFLVMDLDQLLAQLREL